MEQLQRVRGLALDIDGTITVRRGTYLLDLEVAGLLRRLEERGVRVMLVSGNALPVVAGLARYLGLRGPHVAENGCLVFIPEREEIVSVCSYSCRAEAEEVGRRLAGLLRPSWQNPFRLYDYAFRVTGGEPRKAVELVSGVLEELGGRCEAVYSGYAVHVRPRGASKGRGLAAALKTVGLAASEVLAVGDSVTDVEMGEAGVALAAVADADEELRRTASMVLPEPAARGVAWLATRLLGTS